MDTQGLISCIVPVFDAERFVGEALDSILAQTYRPLEIIVTDDGSTDGAASLVAGYGHEGGPLFISGQRRNRCGMQPGTERGMSELLGKGTVVGSRLYNSLVLLLRAPAYRFVLGRNKSRNTQTLIDFLSRQTATKHA